MNELCFNPMYSRFECDLLEGSLAYSKKILCYGEGNLTSDMPVPDVIGYTRILSAAHSDSGRKELLYDLEHTELSSQIDLLKSIEYTVDVEYASTVFLDSLRRELVDFEDNFKSVIPRAQVLLTVEAYRDSLLKMLGVWNLKFLKYLSTNSKNEEQVKRIIKDYIHNRLDAKLLNLRIAKKFFDCYVLVKNFDKGYLLLSRAFEENKKVLSSHEDRQLTFSWILISSTSAKNR